MYDYLKGKITKSSVNRVTLEVNNIGYLISVPASFSSSDSLVTLYVSFVVREDSQTLFGFLEVEERDLFNSLMNVQGIGPKTALAIIGNISCADLASALVKKDTGALCKVPGIGKKTAERLLIELKDLYPNLIAFAPKLASQPKHSKDAISALMNLGYTQHAAMSAVQKALQVDPQSKDLAGLITLSLKQI